MQNIYLERFVSQFSQVKRMQITFCQANNAGFISSKQVQSEQQSHNSDKLIAVSMDDSVN